jgi:hypothetical protein
MWIRRLNFIIRMMKLGRMRSEGHVEFMGRTGMHVAYWWEKPEGKRPLGRPRRGWNDNINISLSELGWGGKDWIVRAHYREQWRALVNTVKNSCVDERLASADGLNCVKFVSHYSACHNKLAFPTGSEGHCASVLMWYFIREF